MSQHDFNIANQGAAAARADINNALVALATTSSGGTAPANTFANMMWYDTTANILKMRNEADSVWINLGTLDQGANTFGVPNATNLTGTSTSNIPTATLATGTANTTTYLRGDRTWQTLSITPTTAQVLTATAGATVGEVGTYALLGFATSTTASTGSNHAGSLLRYSSAGASYGSAPSGTWKCMGNSVGGSGNYVTLFLRIS